MMLMSQAKSSPVQGDDNTADPVHSLEWRLLFLIMSAFPGPSTVLGT